MLQLVRTFFPYNCKKLFQVITSLVLGSAVAAPQDYQSYLSQLHQYRWRPSWRKQLNKTNLFQDGVSA